MSYGQFVRIYRELATFEVLQVQECIDGAWTTRETFNLLKDAKAKEKALALADQLRTKREV